MKKKSLVLISLLIITSITVFHSISLKGRTPFEDINIDDIQAVTVTLQPPNATHELTTEEEYEACEKLSSLGNRIGNSN